ncbi:MAG: hypothetical protein CNLJKLNK_00421 [Holosporales bacterium]
MRFNLYIKVVVLFFLNGYCVQAMTSQLAKDRCKSSMEQIKYPENHTYIETIKFLKSIIQEKIDLIEKAASSDILNLLGDCMDGVDALEWVAKQKGKENAKEGATEKKDQEIKS